MPPAPFDLMGLTMLAMLLVALLLPPALVYEPVWELAAGLGYAACCAAVLTLRISPRPRVAMTAYRFSLHRVAGNALLALVALHVAVMVAGDPFLLDYLGWTMPWHVLAGMLGAVALLLAVATREPVLRGWLRLPGDPRLHGWSAIAAALLVAAHVLPTAGKPTSAWRGALVAGLFAGPGTLGHRGPCRALAAAKPSGTHQSRAARRAAPAARAGRAAIAADRPARSARPLARVRWRHAALSAALALCVAGLAVASRARVAAIAQGPLLPTRFDHKFHTAIGCVTCHHNFLDRSLGPKSCLACHKAWARPSPGGSTSCFMPSAPSAINNGRSPGAAAGPVKSCAACHVADKASRFAVGRH